MGTSKTEAFTETEVTLAKYAKALAHPARVAILRILLERRACICGDIVEELPLSQSTVSQHLKELKNVGLIQGTIEGTSVCYCINPTVWNNYKKLFAEFFKETSLLNNCC